MLSTRKPAPRKLIGLPPYRPFRALSTTRLLVDLVGALPSPFTLECRQETLLPSRFLGSKTRNVRSIDQARLGQKMNVDALLETLEQMHKDVIHLSLRRASRLSERHNAKTHVVPYKPTVGDYVVWCARRDPVKRCQPTRLVPAVFHASSPTSLSSSSILSPALLPPFTSAASSSTLTLRLEPRRR